MAGIGLITAWGGYLFLTYGLALWKWSSDPTSQKLTISDLALPSHRTTYINAMASYTAGGTTSFIGTQANDTAAITQAKADLASCQAGKSGWWGKGGGTCAAASQRLADVTQVTSQATP